MATKDHLSLIKVEYNGVNSLNSFYLWQILMTNNGYINIMRYLDPKAGLTFKRVFGEHPDLVMGSIIITVWFIRTYRKGDRRYAERSGRRHKRSCSLFENGRYTYCHYNGKHRPVGN